MPSTTPERRARWPGQDSEAISFLESRGYTHSNTKDERWCWRRPNPEHEPTEREIDAVIYLIEEWDWGGIVTTGGRELQMNEITAAVWEEFTRSRELYHSAASRLLVAAGWTPVGTDGKTFWRRRGGGTRLMTKQQALDIVETAVRIALEKKKR